MDLFRSDGGNLLRKSVVCISAMIVASAILQSGTASAQEREERVSLFRGFQDPEHSVIDHFSEGLAVLGRLTFCKIDSSEWHAGPPLR